MVRWCYGDTGLSRSSCFFRLLPFEPRANRQLPLKVVAYSLRFVFAIFCVYARSVLGIHPAVENRYPAIGRDERRSFTRRYPAEVWLFVISHYEESIIKIEALSFTVNPAWFWQLEKNCYRNSSFYPIFIGRADLALELVEGFAPKLAGYVWHRFYPIDGEMVKW
jgi:hypothetical protein